MYMQKTIAAILVILFSYIIGLTPNCYADDETGNSDNKTIFADTMGGGASINNGAVISDPYGDSLINEILTDINSVKATNCSKSQKGIIYDLQGHRIKQMKKGHIYIINGKKIIFK